MIDNDFDAINDGIREIKKNKVKLGWSIFYKLVKKYNIIIYTMSNNIVKFNVNEFTFYFTLQNKKIRIQNTKQWSENYLTYIDTFTSSNKISKEDYFVFGKYKGKLIKDIITNDKQYIEWLLNQDWVNNKLIKKINSLKS